MNRRAMWVSLLLWMVVSPPSLAAEYVVPAEEWLRPRSAQRILEMPPVRAAVLEWRREGGVIVVAHASGEAGGLWASEMRDWLIALGLPEDAVQLRPGSPRSGLILSVEDPEGP